MCGKDCKAEVSIDYSELDMFISNLEEKDQSSLIKTLHYAQSVYGYLSVETQTRIAKALNVATSHVYGVVSFYSYFTDKPRGEHIIKVCIGTACYVKGSGDILKVISEMIGVKPGETSDDLQFSLEGTRCIGACGLAPVFTIGEEVYGNTNVEETREIINGYLNK
ncbi:MAG: NAD(P)H-dependent oxidoreductase subunit E [Bacilli bacterium]